jgi:hypothetical protein
MNESDIKYAVARGMGILSRYQDEYPTIRGANKRPLRILADLLHMLRDDWRNPSWFMHQALTIVENERDAAEAAAVRTERSP